MPYKTKKYKGKTCVYKKDTGKKVGCTKGPKKKYLAALHAAENKKTKKLKEAASMEEIVNQEPTEYISTNLRYHGLVQINKDRGIVTFEYKPGKKLTRRSIKDRITLRFFYKNLENPDLVKMALTDHTVMDSVTFINPNDEKVNKFISSKGLALTSQEIEDIAEGEAREIVFQEAEKQRKHISDDADGEFVSDLKPLADSLEFEKLFAKILSE